MTAAYDADLAAKFCGILSEGDKSIAEICKAKDMPSKATVFRWKAENEEFAKMYDLAKDMQIELQIDECTRIADKCKADKDAVAKARLQINTRMERAQLLRPKVYSKHATQELTGKEGGPLIVEIVQFGQSPNPE